MKMILAKQLPELTPLRESLAQAYRMDEGKCIEELLQIATLPDDILHRITQRAHQLILNIRQQHFRYDELLNVFMRRYDLSSDEGIALMCLAETMLRVPDSGTVDKLIREKIAEGDWSLHRNISGSIFINAATWGLMLTGNIFRKTTERHFTNALKHMVGRMGEPVVRKIVREGMKIFGEQFILGHTIETALKGALKLEKLGYRFSYDMLGEAARTAEDAETYFSAYEHAIRSIGEAAQRENPIKSAGISVKLSALHPRYEFAKRENVFPIVAERLTVLAELAARYDMGLTLDAEEANRFWLSLDIFEHVFSRDSLKNWEGLGVVVQTYQKRAYRLIDWLADLADHHKKRLMLRVVKGAYWDSEIKDSQIGGYEGYPVFTRKESTDVSYLVCAKKIIERNKLFYPQFATHNAYTVSTVLELMNKQQDFEFQRLQGMGRSLYDQMVEEGSIACRVYAPVGRHKDLLPYLIRRLLENGANTSFINRVVNEKIPIEDLIIDPVEKIRALKIKTHPKIPLPENIYGKFRKNSQGLDFSDEKVLRQLSEEMTQFAGQQWTAHSTLIGESHDDRQTKFIVEPSDHRCVVGEVIEATVDDARKALEQGEAAACTWDQLPVKKRADCLFRAADLFEKYRSELMALIIREAGKTLQDALSEVREAIDFCRYYALQARAHLKTHKLPGPTGESNELQMHGRGIIACISPWNFPLAIFTGQVSAALAAGNAVIAKPADKTPLIAARAVALMHEAGIPLDVLQLLPGRGSVVGTALVADERVKGVMFTGGTETAQFINRSLANRSGAIVPLIAETGGQNAMIVDSTALPEQVIVDVLISAFGSAGQRCSSLRVLFIQEEIAPKIIHMLKGAMMELEIGYPGLLSTDIGPVIDVDAKRMLEAHAIKMNKLGQLIYRVTLPEHTKHGSFFAPRAYEIKSIDMLEREVFGPILHVIRYRHDDLDKVIDSVNRTQYGLTLGIHSRIDATARTIQQHAHVGNTYVNRNMIGAVVGVQPFGGESLSGTGPKAGGPNYLTRLCKERTLTINTAAIGGNAALMAMDGD